MRFRILGSAPGMPVQGKNHACLWLNSQNRDILFDCGEGASQQLMKYKLDKDEIDTIIISHMHPDHITGIYMVLLMFRLNGRTKDLTIYLPEAEKEFTSSLGMFYLFRQKYPFAIAIRNIADLEINWIEPLESDHLLRYEEFIISQKMNNKMRSYSFLISEGNKQIIYTSDLLSLKYIKDYIAGAELIILDSSHPGYEQLSSSLIESEIKIILNHGMSEAAEKLISQLPGSRYEFADETQEIII